MKVKRISASCLKSFHQCEFKYYLNYIAGLRQPGNEKMLIGNVVHYALEMFAHGKTDYKKYLKKGYKDYKLKDVSLDNEVTFATCVKLTEEVLNRKVNPILAYKVLGIEKEFHMDFNGIPAIGYIDLLSAISKNIVEIRDWKSGSFIQTIEEVEKDLQPKIYDLAVSEMYPGKKIWVTLDYIQNVPKTVRYSEEDRVKNKNEILGIIKDIQQVKRPKRRKGKWGDWKCKYMCITRDECDKCWKKFYHADFPDKEVTTDKKDKTNG